MNATLTERYIAATVKSLPGASQDDVRAELAASIADAVEARIEQGESRDDAERAVLTGLGDPAKLAAGYADRPLQLIGPRYYLAWWRLLKLLLIIVPACAAGGVALGQALADESIGTIIAQSISVGLSVVVHVSFWVTLVFVILDRAGAAAVDWDVDQLPEPAPTGTGRADLIASLVLLGLAVGVILWDRLRGFAFLDGETLPVLDPGLWPGWIAALFALLAAEALLVVVVAVRGRWSVALAIANTALAVLFLSWALTLLGRGQLVNPEFLQAVFLANGVDQDTLHILAVLLGFGIVAVSAWDAADGWLKARRARRGSTGR